MGMTRRLATNPDDVVVTWYSPDKDMYYDNEGSPRNQGDTGISCNLKVGYSANGFVWTMDDTAQFSNTIMMDGSVLQGWDERFHKWIVWARVRCSSDRTGKYRTQGVILGDDLLSLPFPEATLVPDSKDPPGMQFDRFAAAPVPGGYAGLVTAQHTSSKEGYRMEPQLVYSRDVRTWVRMEDRSPYLPVGERGSWDDMMIFPCRIVTRDDTVYILYAGGNLGNVEWYVEKKKGVTVSRRFAEGARLPDGTDLRRSGDTETGPLGFHRTGQGDRCAAD